MGWSSPRSPDGERHTDFVHFTSSCGYAGRVSPAERTSLRILITLKTPSLVSLRMNILGPPVARLTIVFHVYSVQFFRKEGEGAITREIRRGLAYKTGVISLVAG